MWSYPTPPWPLEEREAATQRLRAVAARFRELAIEAAAALEEVKRTGAHWKAGAASIREFAERNGMSGFEATTYERLADGLAAFPDCRDALRRGEITVAAAAVLGEVSQLPEAGHRPDDQWVEWAKTEGARTLRRRFEKRRAELRAGGPVVQLVADVTPEARDDVHRARVLASRPEHYVLTVGETIGLVFADWLDRNDPLRKTPGPRRVPDTATRPDDRYIPIEVDLAIRKRENDCCAVPFCSQAFWVHRAHRVPHRDGSGRETKDLHILCDYHNFLHEMGDLRIGGTAEKPIFTDRNGVPLGRRAVWSLGWQGDPRAETEGPSDASPRPAKPKPPTGETASPGTALPGIALPGPLPGRPRPPDSGIDSWYDLEATFDVDVDGESDSRPRAPP